MNAPVALTAEPPPHSIEAEQAVLGAILFSAGAFELIERTFPVVAEDFFEPLHQALFDRFQRERGQGRHLDARLAAIALGELGHVTVFDLTVNQYVARLLSASPPASAIVDYARVVREFAARRRMVEVAMTLTAAAATGTQMADVTTLAIEDLYSITAMARAGKPSTVTIASAMDSSLEAMNYAYQNPGKLQGISTGLRDLDDAFGGLQEQDLYILAGRPGMGKSAVAGSIARAVADAEMPVHFFSLEMSEVRIAERILADLAYFAGERIEYRQIPRGRVNEKQAELLYDLRRRFARKPLTIDNQGGLSIAQISTRSRRAAQRLERQGQRLRLIIVDHIHLMNGGSRYAGNRVGELGEITNGLKSLAKELSVPILALAQLNRAVENRDNKRATLADLRESGSIEQDADAVMFAFREAYYLKDRLDDAAADALRLGKLAQVTNKLELGISKNRHGPTSTIDLFCEIDCNAVRSVSRIDYGRREGDDR